MVGYNASLHECVLTNAVARAGGKPIFTTRPTAAEREVDDDVLWAKVRGEVAVRVGEVREWRALARAARVRTLPCMDSTPTGVMSWRAYPSASVNEQGAVLDVPRDVGVVALPVPHPDVRIGTLHCVPASANGVEGRAVARRAGSLRAAAFGRTVHIAVSAEGRAVIKSG